MTYDYLIHGSRRYVPEATMSSVVARVPHDVERVDVNALIPDLRYRGNVAEYRNDLRGGPPRGSADPGEPVPEVYRLDPLHATIADCAVQRMWRGISPDLSDERWSSLMGGNLGFMNKGAGMPGHYNCITGEGEGLTFPRFDQPRVCGGAILYGTLSNGIYHISSILTSAGVPSAAEAMAHPEWWYYGTSVNISGEVNLITRPSGENSDGPNVPVRVPLVTAVPVSLPADELHILPPGFISPDPRWMPN